MPETLAFGVLIRYDVIRNGSFASVPHRTYEELKSTWVPLDQSFGKKVPHRTYEELKSSCGRVAARNPNCVPHRTYEELKWSGPTRC